MSADAWRARSERLGAGDLRTNRSTAVDFGSGSRSPRDCTSARYASICAAIAITVAGCCPHAIMSDRWHRATLASSTALIACDWGMTRWMPKTGAYERGYVELNPLLGRRPSATTIDVVFILAITANVAAYPYLPKWARAWWYTTATALEVGNVLTFNPSGVCGDFGAMR